MAHWVHSSWTSTSFAQDEDEQSAVMDDITSLPVAFAGEAMEAEAVTRQFNFPGQQGEVGVEFNDAPLSSKEYTSVGHQSWASSILLADRICLKPEQFVLTLDPGRTLRVLELGAGTGLLSIVAAKVLFATRSEFIATDYHPDVLSNLTSKLTFLEFPLDWQYPAYTGPFAKPFFPGVLLGLSNKAGICTHDSSAIDLETRRDE